MLAAVLTFRRGDSHENVTLEKKLALASGKI
jgi:hypothetical protein